MARIYFGVGVVCFLMAPFAWSDDPNEESVYRNTLAVQVAMEQAQHVLHKVQPPQFAKAVELLERQVKLANGNPKYLQLLRESYRGYVKELHLAGQSEHARVYLERLAILDPSAAQDVSLRSNPPSLPQAPAAAPEKKARVFPDFALTNPFRKQEPRSAPTKPIVRAQSEQAETHDDPFSPSNQRPAAEESQPKNVARELISKADQEFTRRRYNEARYFYEQAIRADADALAMSKDRYGYCVLSQIVEKLNAGTKDLAEIQTQTEWVIRFAPNLANEGGKVLQEIQLRRPAGAAPMVNATITPAANVHVKHLGKNREGWLVAETTHFLIFHHQTDEFAEQVARIAEQTRATMSKKWLNSDGETWEPRCEVILHPTTSSYLQMNEAAPSSSPGHSRIERDRTNPARVIRRKVDIRCDGAGWMEGVLPHEITHVVLAGQFGPFDVPRWVDEGIAVLSEPIYKIEQHHRNLAKAHQEGTLLRLQELLQADNYPQPRQISAFYAQSVSLVEYLSSQKGPHAFTQFVRDALREGYDGAFRRHYGMSMGEFDQRWSQHIAQDRGRLATR